MLPYAPLILLCAQHLAGSQVWFVCVRVPLPAEALTHRHRHVGCGGGGYHLESELDAIAATQHAHTHIRKGLGTRLQLYSSGSSQPASQRPQSHARPSAGDGLGVRGKLHLLTLDKHSLYTPTAYVTCCSCKNKLTVLSPR